MRDEKRFVLAFGTLTNDNSRLLVRFMVNDQLIIRAALETMEACYDQRLEAAQKAGARRKEGTP